MQGSQHGERVGVLRLVGVEGRRLAGDVDIQDLLSGEGAGARWGRPADPAGAAPGSWLSGAVVAVEPPHAAATIATCDKTKETFL